METTAANDPYRALRLARAATPDEVRDAYRRRAFESHPDRAGGSASEFLAVAEAYRVLSDPRRRSEYDAAHPRAAPLATVGPPEASAPEEASPCAEPEVAEVAIPVAEAARSLFEYLTEVARRMILEGSAPAVVIASLRAEGCPESVASALERDLRAALRPERPAPAPDRGRRRVRAAAACAVALAAAAAVAMVRPAHDEPDSLARAASPSAAPAAAIAVPAVPAPAPTAPAPAAAAPAPERLRHATRPKVAPPSPAARPEPRLTLAETSAALDGEKVELERAWRALEADSAALQEERVRIDAAAASLGDGAAPVDAAAVRRAQAGYNARLEAARGRERALQRRTAELNTRLQAYNARVVAAREGRP